jgi:hypothetical protein
MNMSYFVYKYVCDGDVIYVGKTDDIHRRVVEHASGQGLEEKFVPYLGRCDIYFHECGNEVEMSVRLMTFRDQMQDTRAFLLLESYTDRETVCNLIRKHIPDISLNCKVSAEQLLALRNDVNTVIGSFI